MSSSWHHARSSVVPGARTRGGLHRSIAARGRVRHPENSLESWPNLFSIHALDALGLPLNGEVAQCPAGVPVPYASWDAWDGLCFLMQFQYAYGWSFYADFFAELNVARPGLVPSGPAAWTYVHDRFEAIAGADVTPTFAAWGVPNPG